jgi:hypothetical protein
MRDDAGDVSVEVLPVFGTKQVLAAFDGKNNMDINLRECVSHEVRRKLGHINLQDEMCLNKKQKRELG